jgi:hypothetical protein
MDPVVIRSVIPLTLHDMLLILQGVGFFHLAATT